MKYFRTKAGKLLLTLMLLLCVVPAAKTRAANIVIVLDPGHGGSESGATRTHSGKTYKEEVINMKIAQYCKAELETYAGVTVYLTRNSVSQTAQDRETRVNIAKKLKANALVSLHINSGSATSQTSITGAYAAVPSTKTWPASKSATAEEARTLAKAILTELNSELGLKNNGFWIDDELGIILFGQKKNYSASQASSLGISKSILNTRVPTMIIEHCFINNPNDCKNYLSTDEKIKKLGVADAAGIAKYYGLSKKSSSNTTTETTKKGVVKSGSSLYLYNNSGELQRGLVKYDGKYYYANSKGKLLTGWRTVNSKKYYFDKTTGAAKTGLTKIGKYKYYFSKKGVMQKKWVTISGKKYYFSKVNGRLLTKYWLKYNGKWYYLDKNGTPYKNCKKKIKGKTYKFNSKGICTNKK